MTCVTWPGVTAEQRNMGVLTPMTGVACDGDLQVEEATMWACFGCGSMLLVSVLLLLMLTCSCSKGACGVGSVISTGVQFEGEHLASYGLLEGLA